ncbi:hypothetical protein CP532_2611 [Ophiocordyceps camponoti-leonardi (nom. inval.)]|nr:hypothetical protein CP532_2611 [Ophiocordyceps camponoti-leonardi (nom. inval.)]
MSQRHPFPVSTKVEKQEVRDHPPPASSSSSSVRQADDDDEAYEDAHVHDVYEAIASHFSSTRHKPWPRVARFLQDQRTGSVGVDVGCGNGKYQPVNGSVVLLGCDACASLVRLARTERGAEVVTAHGLALPYRKGEVDFAICIAVVHHYSTRGRRREAIGEVLSCLRPDVGSHALFYVWALEQPLSRRGWDVSSEQDALVPWVARPEVKKGTGTGTEMEMKTETRTYQRYYHLYAQGELEQDVVAAGGEVVESGYERDNWWVVCRRALG